MLGYEWDFSIKLNEFMTGIGAVISATAIVAGGIIWLINKLNKNTTVIKSILPYMRIGTENSYMPIKSQHEFSQIIRDVPLDILQTASIAYFVRFNSIDKNENKIIYKSCCKLRLGIKLLFEIIKDNSASFFKKMKIITKPLCSGKHQEDYIFRNQYDAEDTIHKTEHEFTLDPLFLLSHKDISISVKIMNSNKSQTSWCKCKLCIEGDALKSMTNKIPQLKTEEEQQNWLKKWREDFTKNNKNKFDLEMCQ